MVINRENKPAVSVIVPVYQVEAYLPRCLNSLCCQSLSNIEIIVVDDASTDNCGTICEEFASKDARMKVFHQTENRGLSAARNLGIKNATGHYLMFVDSDDWVHEDFCKEAYEYAESHQADLVMFNYKKTTETDDTIEKVPAVFRSFREGYHDPHEAMDMILADGGNAAWNKIYRKYLFDDISYPEGFLYEDTGATYKLVHKASHFCFLNQALYYQRKRPGSITTTSVSKKELSDRATLNTQRYRDLKAWEFQSDMLEYRFLNFALWYCIHQRRDLSNPDYVNLAQALHSAQSAPLLFSIKKKIVFYLFKYCPYIFEMLFILKGDKVK